MNIHKYLIAEIRSGISTSTTVVRSAAALFQPVSLRFPERHSPPRRHLAAGHLFHHARRL